MNSRSILHPLAETLIYVAVACSAGALAACSGSAVPPARATPPAAAATSPQGPDAAALDAAVFATGIVTKRKACDLMIRPDAEVALGQPLPQNTVILGLGMCDFNASDFRRARA